MNICICICVCVCVYTYIQTSNEEFFTTVVPPSTSTTFRQLHLKAMRFYLGVFFFSKLFFSNFFFPPAPFEGHALLPRCFFFYLGVCFSYLGDGFSFFLFFFLSRCFCLFFFLFSISELRTRPSGLLPMAPARLILCFAPILNASFCGFGFAASSSALCFSRAWMASGLYGSSGLFSGSGCGISGSAGVDPPHPIKIK